MRLASCLLRFRCWLRCVALAGCNLPGKPTAADIVPASHRHSRSGRALQPELRRMSRRRRQARAGAAHRRSVYLAIVDDDSAAQHDLEGQAGNRDVGVRGRVKAAC